METKVLKQFRILPLIPAKENKNIECKRVGSKNGVFPCSFSADPRHRFVHEQIDQRDWLSGELAMFSHITKQTSPSFALNCNTKWK